jgi:small subunit ribosomal protein S9
MAKVDSNENVVRTSGSRKTAVARVFLYPEKGEIFVNDKKIDDHFSREVEQVAWKKPFHTIGISHPGAQFRGTIKVSGSGPSAQLDAIVHGISRALAEMDEEYRTALSKAGLLTRDPRMVERKKYYLRKARKRPQYSKR